MHSKPIATITALINSYTSRIYEVKPVRAHYYYKTFQRLFAAYLVQNYYAEDMPLGMVNDTTIEGFARYLDGCNISDRSRTVYNRILRQALFSVNERGELTADMLVRRHSNNVDYLDAEELLAMVATPMPSERLAKVRDTFLFMCFTGISHDDVLEMTDDQLAPYENGIGLLLHNTTTGERVVIPMLKIPQRIIDKYADRPDERLLPGTSSATTNSYIKEVGQICGIGKHLTLCVARNTFAATVAGQNLMAAPVLAWLLGTKFHCSGFPNIPLENGQIEREILKVGRKLAWMNKHLAL